MILESLINFERFQIVRINPDNPGTHKMKSKGIIRIINVHKKQGWEDPVRTGYFQVLWNKEHRTKEIHYSNLIIIK